MIRRRARPLPLLTILYYILLDYPFSILYYGSASRWPRNFVPSSEMVATAVDLSNLPPLVAPPGTSIAIHQATVLGHLLTQPSTSELAQVISYEAYAPPPAPQPLPAPTEKTVLPSEEKQESSTGELFSWLTVFVTWKDAVRGGVKGKNDAQDNRKSTDKRLNASITSTHS